MDRRLGIPHRWGLSNLAGHRSWVEEVEGSRLERGTFKLSRLDVCEAFCSLGNAEERRAEEEKGRDLKGCSKGALRTGFGQLELIWGF